MKYLERVNKRLKPCDIFLNSNCYNCHNCHAPFIIMSIIMVYVIYVIIDECINSFIKKRL
jgi:hypothetical protein